MFAFDFQPCKTFLCSSTLVSATLVMLLLVLFLIGFLMITKNGGLSFIQSKDKNFKILFKVDMSLNRLRFCLFVIEFSKNSIITQMGIANQELDNQVRSLIFNSNLKNLIIGFQRMKFIFFAKNQKKKLLVVIVAHIYPPVNGQRQTLTYWTIRSRFITTTTSRLEESAPA